MTGRSCATNAHSSSQCALGFFRCKKEKTSQRQESRTIISFDAAPGKRGFRVKAVLGKRHKHGLPSHESETLRQHLSLFLGKKGSITRQGACIVNRLAPNPAVVFDGDAPFSVWARTRSGPHGARCGTRRRAGAEFMQGVTQPMVGHAFVPAQERDKSTGSPRCVSDTAAS